MVDRGWVELGFHEERPHQITPISLPAEQVSSQNQYWELDSLEDPPRGGDPHPHQGQVTPTGQLMTAVPQRADTRTDPYDPGNRSQGRDNNPQPLRHTLASRVETPNISLHDHGHDGLAESHPMHERPGRLREVGRHPRYC